MRNFARALQLHAPLASVFADFDPGVSESGAHGVSGGILGLFSAAGQLDQRRRKTAAMIVRRRPGWCSVLPPHGRAEKVASKLECTISLLSRRYGMENSWQPRIKRLLAVLGSRPGDAKTC